ncbi:hypothetical protein IV203_016508 [Nitzschia inconspicua]|uniref:Uncharacterized protein n=1 Tax=Nitzschia inconspicua TaxID=303405 RepID=A0A9K3PHR2_9STRA|nr:hypothetical protein IV203_016508 [Nitzschia inconspicua]
MVPTSGSSRKVRVGDFFVNRGLEGIVRTALKFGREFGCFRGGNGFPKVGCGTNIFIFPEWVNISHTQCPKHYWVSGAEDGVGIGHSRCPKQCRVSVEEDAVGTGPKEKMIGRETTKKPRRRLGLQRNRL